MQYILLWALGRKTSDHQKKEHEALFMYENKWNAQRIIAFDLDLDKITIHNQYAPLCFGGVVSIDDDLSVWFDTWSILHARVDGFIRLV